MSGRGETFKSGGRVVKNVTGYDLCKLIAGSWGTLAVMTDVTLKTLPRAETEATQMRYTKQDNNGALFWADRGVGYVVSGSSDRERLMQVARLVYDQTEKSGG